MTAPDAKDESVDEVEEFLTAMVRPARRDPPRVAERLRGIRPDRVPTPYGTVATWRIGTGPAVLLVHGFDDDHTLWEPMLDALVARGRAAVVFDLPAHGLSTGDSGMGWEAASAAEVLIAEYDPVDAAVGHSIGALGLIAALTHSQVALSRAALISTPLNTVNRWHRNAKRFGMPNEIADRARALYETRVPHAKLPFDAAADLARIDIPLLLVNSADDIRAQLADAQRASAGCPNVQLHAVDGLGHRRTARDPSVAAAVADFLDEPTRKQRPKSPSSTTNCR